jgi:hypothetical protein
MYVIYTVFLNLKVKQTRALITNMKENHPRLQRGRQRKYSFEFHVTGTSQKLYTLIS